MVKFKSKFDKKYMSDGLKAHMKIRLKLIKYMPFEGIVSLIILIVISLLGNSTISFSVLEVVMILSFISPPHFYFIT